MARMTGCEVAGEMADVMAALVEHFEAPLPA